MSIDSNRVRVTFLLTLLISAGCNRSVAPTSSSPIVDGGPVTIEINATGTTETLIVQNVPSGSTVEQVMRMVDQVPVTIHGSGVTAFVDRIGDVSTGGKSGWTYKVDGQFANKGIGATKITPPTTITWSYGDYSNP